tara:strand:+ start:963 stop:1229 length:267 start_codon:yes stop_codon:yes gene_type:complete
MTLNPAQFDELIEQYVDLCVDSMDYKSLEEFVRNTLIDDFSRLSTNELKDEIRFTFDEDTLDELIDNVSRQYVEVSYDDDPPCEAEYR